MRRAAAFFMVFQFFATGCATRSWVPSPPRTAARVMVGVADGYRAQENPQAAKDCLASPHKCKLLRPTRHPVDLVEPEPALTAAKIGLGVAALGVIVVFLATLSSHDDDR